MTRAAVLLLAGLLPALMGCVAAAVPLAAGAVIARRVVAPASPGTAPVAQASATSDVKITPLTLTELPPPDPMTSALNSAVAAFRAYALDQLATPPGTSKRPGALLSRASDLRSDRAECKAARPAVFIDLDPGRGTFDPLAAGVPDRELVATLLELRAQGVEIVWFSRLGTGFADAARAALSASGFDPEGRDELVLLNTLDERKQTRRDEVAKRVCPIALVGDERADFDELYLYLKNADAAIALDAMIGRGWFLAAPFAVQAQNAPPPPNP